MLIADCLEACKGNVLRTDDEARDVREKAAVACRKLGIEFPEDAKELLSSNDRILFYANRS